MDVAYPGDSIIPPPTQMDQQIRTERSTSHHPSDFDRPLTLVQTPLESNFFTEDPGSSVPPTDICRFALAQRTQRIVHFGRSRRWRKVEYAGDRWHEILREREKGFEDVVG